MQTFIFHRTGISANFGVQNLVRLAETNFCTACRVKFHILLILHFFQSCERGHLLVCRRSAAFPGILERHTGSINWHNMFYNTIKWQIFPIGNICNKTTSSYNCSTPHFSMSCASDSIARKCHCIQTTFLFSKKPQNLTRALGQSLLTISNLLVNVNIVTCLAVWQSLLQCKWQGTLHQRCHWRKGYQN